MNYGGVGAPDLIQLRELLRSVKIAVCRPNLWSLWPYQAFHIMRIVLRAGCTAAIRVNRRAAARGQIARDSEWCL